MSIICLCGPTATGKTAASIELAQRLDGEIISVDSGQIYRGMDIGTAKPTLEEQSQARFHLINICDPNEIFSAADFERLAIQAIHEIQSRGKRVILCGGTGLYLKSLEEGVFEGPSKDETIRRTLEEEIAQGGLAALRYLHDELQRVDPAAAAGIPFQNKQRLIRALEVYRLTGKPISQFWREQKAQEVSPRFEITKYALELNKEELHQRIDQRVDVMMEMGLIHEAESLLEKWGRQAPGLKLIGYKECLGGMVEGMASEEIAALIKKNTRQYAKRQMTWFKKDKNVVWLEQFSKNFIT